MVLSPGDKITVYDENKVELGDGTFVKIERFPELRMIAYECREHTILAKSIHYVRRQDEFVKVELDGSR